MTPRWFIGLSSGSSLSGIDAALVSVDGIGLDAGVRLAHFVHTPYSRDVRDALLAATTTASIRQLALLHRILGELSAGAVRQLAQAAKLDLSHVWCIGSSGHTL